MCRPVENSHEGMADAALSEFRRQPSAGPYDLWITISIWRWWRRLAAVGRPVGAEVEKCPKY